MAQVWGTSQKRKVVYCSNLKLAVLYPYHLTVRSGIVSRSVSRAVVVKSLNVCIEIIITLPKALMPLTAAPAQYRQLDPSVNLPQSKSRAVFAPSELSSDLLVIYLSSDCILMLPIALIESILCSVSVLGRPLLRFGLRHNSSNWLICLASPALERAD